MEPNTQIYALNELIVTYHTILQSYTHYRLNFRGWLLVSELLGYMVAKRSCDIKINIKIVKIAV